MRETSAVEISNRKTFLYLVKDRAKITTELKMRQDEIREIYSEMRTVC